MSEFTETSAALPGPAAIGRRLATMSIMDFAIDLAPNITQSNSMMEASTTPIEYILSETAEVDDAWRSHDLYGLLQAQKLGGLIIRQNTKPEDIAEKIELVEASLLTVHEPTTDNLRNGALQQFIVRSARYDALKRVGLLSRQADELPLDVRAAYEFAAVRQDLPLDEVATKRRQDTERAHRIYAARAFHTMVLSAPYEALRIAERATAKQWWNQLARDLQRFSVQTI